MKETTIFGHPDEGTLKQMRDVASRAAYTALMADAHVGYIMPIGGVAAYRNQVSVAGVGFDIACGNAALRLDRRLGDDLNLEQLADEIQDTLSFGIGRNNKAHGAPVDHPLFESDAWNAVPAQHREQLRDRARSQLGTVGSGNHYVDIFTDQDGHIWVGVHFGSRGLGHAIASNFMAMQQGLKWGERGREVEALLSLDSQMGRDYWALMELAGQYAYAGREWVARLVAGMIGGREVELVHNHHNYAWKETHFGEELVVVRKGATPAFPGQKGFVGGSMGDDAVILQGSRADSDLQKAALYSTVHGAGRVLSRSAAAGRWNRQRTKQIRPGQVSPDEMRRWIERKGVILRGGGLDEAPQAYRRLKDVIRAQGETIDVLHTLKPHVVVMAGAGVLDPYRD
jgi:tRNA-splicing ligase RtcB